MIYTLSCTAISATVKTAKVKSEYTGTTRGFKPYDEVFFFPISVTLLDVWVGIRRRGGGNKK